MPVKEANRTNDIIANNNHLVALGDDVQSYKILKKKKLLLRKTYGLKIAFA